MFHSVFFILSSVLVIESMLKKSQTTTTAATTAANVGTGILPPRCPQVGVGRWTWTTSAGLGFKMVSRRQRPTPTTRTTTTPTTTPRTRKTTSRKGSVLETCRSSTSLWVRVRELECPLLRQGTLHRFCLYGVPRSILVRQPKPHLPTSLYAVRALSDVTLRRTCS